MKFRTDIQALRGLAVLLVVLHHASVGFLGGGYLGVDIFFVVSGYLITGLVKRAIEQGTFSFSEFYWRRAKRLLPAAYVTFLVTAILSLFFLGANELRDFAKQLAGAVSFTGNIALWRQSGYFDGAATLKPLLHVWSLSIEEQYYLILPASLVFLPKRYWIWGASLVLLASLALCLVLVPLRPTAAFYLLPTRAWEMAIGSLAALSTLDGVKVRRAVAFLFWPALAAILVIPIAPIGTAHPGLDAIVVCLATIVVILRRHEVLNTTLIPRLLAKVGDFSYSLYLVHWPVFAFMNNGYIGEPPATAYAVAVVVAFSLGFLLYRYVELPVRHIELQPSPWLVRATVAASLALVSVPFSVNCLQASAIDYTQVRRENYGLNMACDFSGNFSPKAECKNGDAPTLLVWGDSFAMHLVPGIAATANGGVVQATQSMCGPFVGLAPMDNGSYNRTWAEQCLAFNQSVLDYLATAKSVQVVVISSTFGQYLEVPDKNRMWRSLVNLDGQLTERQPTTALAIAAMRYTVEKVRALGKRVVIVAPPPSSGFDIGLCLERKATGRLILGANRDCSVPVADYYAKRAPVLNFLKQLHTEARVNIVNFDAVLCSETICATELDGKFVYRDSGHLSYDGSELMARKMDWGVLLPKSAS
jgi:peptidoglycan/LPS O-acetylase OafA/YrhL